MKQEADLIRKHFTKNLLVAACGTAAYERGENYFRQGRVVEIDVLRLSADRTDIFATTLGSGHRRYHQDISIFSQRKRLFLEGSCSCPVGYNCKHVVAACLVYLNRLEVQREDPDNLALFNDWLAGYAKPKDLEPQQNSRNRPEFIVYTLSSGLESVEVILTIVKLKQNGEFSKGRKTTISTINNRFTNPHYVQRIDEDIADLLEASNKDSWGKIELKGAPGHLALSLMLNSGRAFWGKQSNQSLRQGAERNLSFKWVEDQQWFHLQVDCNEDEVLVPVTPPMYLDTQYHEVGELKLPPEIDIERFHTLCKAPPIPRKKAKQISYLLALQQPELPTPIAVEITDLGVQVPQPRLTIDSADGSYRQERVGVDFIYSGEIEVVGDTVQHEITLETEQGLLRFKRDTKAEAKAISRLCSEGLFELPGRPMQFVFALNDTDQQTHLATWFKFMNEVVPRLQNEGWLIVEKLQSAISFTRSENLFAEVDTSGRDWFELRFDIEVEGEKIPLLPLVSELIGDYEPGNLPEQLYLSYGQGRYVEVAGQQIEPILQNLVELYDSTGKGGELKLSRFDAPRLLEFGDLDIRGGSDFKRLAEKLKHFDRIKQVKPPTTFKGKLRSYQQQGLDWLQFLREYELAGILADDMGLGKTVQALANLAVEKRAGRMKLPCLVIAPTSLMGNWRREAALFTPRLKVLVLHGPARSDHFDTLHAYDLILTTYPLLTRDREVLLNNHYHYLILDEAQQIKNPRSQAAQVVRDIEAIHRLCLTGTPMENHLGELWAQFDFLMPGFLGDQKQFSRNYRTPVEIQGDQQRMQSLSNRIKPFMLRRIKQQVAKELPEKSELLRSISIAGKQAALYESIRLSMEKKVRDAINKKGLARSHITILDALLKLRQVCCDPQLLSLNTKHKNVPSAKLQMLMEMLPELLDEGRRILLFSQFTSMLGVIEKELKALRISYTKLTGQTRKRDEAIEAFRSGKVDLFLISLKAGGVGLNLTEADTVIHYDPWWNPAVENQATDRAYRIGQDKPVFVYKLITEGTVEEKILALQEKKQQLANSVYGKTRKEGELLFDADTIKDLLGE